MSTINNRHNIFFCLDENYIPCLKYVLNSFIKCNKPHKYNIHFIITLDKLTFDEFKNIIITVAGKVSKNFNLVIKEFVPPIELVELVNGYCKILDKRYPTNAKCAKGTFINIGNWSRFYISYLFPDVKTGLYLDLDILFNGNIEEIFSIDFGDNVIGAINDTTTHKKHTFEKSYDRFIAIFDVELMNKLKIKQEDYNRISYNCGVMYINFELYRERNFLNILLDILKHTIKHNIVQFRGTQGILHIIAPNYTLLPNKFNVITKRKYELAEASILHFKGISKFWDNHNYRELYNKFMCK